MGAIQLSFYLIIIFFLTIVDDHTRHTWIYLMKNKSETINLLSNFVINLINILKQ